MHQQRRRGQPHLDGAVGGSAVGRDPRSRRRGAGCRRGGVPLRGRVLREPVPVAGVGRTNAARHRDERPRVAARARIPRASSFGRHLRDEEPEVGDVGRGGGPALSGVLGAARVEQARPGEDGIADRHPSRREDGARGRSHRWCRLCRRPRGLAGRGFDRRRSVLARSAPGDGPLPVHMAPVAVRVGRVRHGTVESCRSGL